VHPPRADEDTTR